MPHDGPLDVIMPALGMAQESGVIVAWHKQPGDAVAEGDVLFEVETDKATMEVEAQGAGYLAGVSAGDGDEVPVGQVIARIADSPEGAGDAPAAASGAASGSGSAAPSSAEELPTGAEVIMPTLGMAQDSGLLVGWLVELGGKVTADDPLFEVETDKSTVEVPAGVDGYLAARLAEAGEDVPTGQVIAIVSAEAPASPISRSSKGAAMGAPAAEPAGSATEPAAAKAAPSAPGTPATAPKPGPKPAPAPQPGGRILASPKARRLALEQGLDLQRLVDAGHPQPYHVRDIEVLKALPADAPAAGGVAASAARRLTAEIGASGFDAFADWAAAQVGLKDRAALLAGMAGASLPQSDPVVAVEAFGATRVFAVPAGPLSAVTETDAAPDLVVRDLRLMRLTSVAMGAEAAPVLTLTAQGDGLALTLECGAGQMTAPDAIACLSNVAGRLEDPLRHLL